MEGMVKVKEEPPDDHTSKVVQPVVSYSASFHGSDSPPIPSFSYEDNFVPSNSSSSVSLAGPTEGSSIHDLTLGSGILHIKQEVDIDYDKERSTQIGDIPSQSGDVPEHVLKAISMPRNWNQVERLKQQRTSLHEKLFSHKLNVSKNLCCTDGDPAEKELSNDSEKLVSGTQSETDSDHESFDENPLQIALSEENLATESCKSPTEMAEICPEIGKPSSIDSISNLLQKLSEQISTPRKSLRIHPRGSKSETSATDSCNTHCSDLCELSATGINQSLQRAIESVEMKAAAFDITLKQRLVKGTCGEQNERNAKDVYHYVVPKPSPRHSQGPSVCKSRSEGSLLAVPTRANTPVPMLRESSIALGKKMETNSDTVLSLGQQSTISSQSFTECSGNKDVCARNTPPTKAMLKKWLERHMDRDIGDSQDSNSEIRTGSSKQNTEISKNAMDMALECLDTAQTQDQIKSKPEKMTMVMESNNSLKEGGVDLNYVNIAMQKLKAWERLSTNFKDNDEELDDRNYSSSDCEIIEEVLSIPEDKCEAYLSGKYMTDESKERPKYNFRKSKMMKSNHSNVERGITGNASVCDTADKISQCDLQKSSDSGNIFVRDAVKAEQYESRNSSEVSDKPFRISQCISSSTVKHDRFPAKAVATIQLSVPSTVSAASTVSSASTASAANAVSAAGFSMMWNNGATQHRYLLPKSVQGKSSARSLLATQDITNKIPVHLKASSQTVVCSSDQVCSVSESITPNSISPAQISKSSVSESIRVAGFGVDASCLLSPLASNFGTFTTASIQCSTYPVPSTASNGPPLVLNPTYPVPSTASNGTPVVLNPTYPVPSTASNGPPLVLNPTYPVPSTASNGPPLVLNPTYPVPSTASNGTPLVLNPGSLHRHPIQLICSPDGRLFTIVDNVLRPVVQEINGSFQHVNQKNLHGLPQKPIPVGKPIRLKKTGPIGVVNPSMVTNQTSIQGGTASKQNIGRGYQLNAQRYIASTTSVEANAPFTCSSISSVQCAKKSAPIASSPAMKSSSDQLEHFISFKNGNILSRSQEMQSEMQENRSMDFKGGGNSSSSIGHMKAPSSAGLVKVPPSSAGLVKAPPSSAGLVKVPPISAGLVKAPPSSAGLVKAPPNSAGLVKVPPNSAGLVKAPPSSAGLVKAPPNSAGLVKAPPSSAGLVKVPPNSAGLVKAPPSSAGLVKVPPNSDGLVKTVPIQIKQSLNQNICNGTPVSDSIEETDIDTWHNKPIKTSKSHAEISNSYSSSLPIYTTVTKNQIEKCHAKPKKTISAAVERLVKALKSHSLPATDVDLPRNESPEMTPTESLTTEFEMMNPNLAGTALASTDMTASPAHEDAPVSSINAYKNADIPCYTNELQTNSVEENRTTAETAADLIRSQNVPNENEMACLRADFHRPNEEKESKPDEIHRIASDTNDAYCTQSEQDVSVATNIRSGQKKRHKKRRLKRRKLHNIGRKPGDIQTPVPFLNFPARIITTSSPDSGRETSMIIASPKIGNMEIEQKTTVCPTARSGGMHIGSLRAEDKQYERGDVQFCPTSKSPPSTDCNNNLNSEESVTMSTELLEQEKKNRELDRLKEEQATLLKYPVEFYRADQVDSDNESYDSIDLERYEDTRRNCDGSEGNSSRTESCHAGIEMDEKMGQAEIVQSDKVVIDAIPIKNEGSISRGMHEKESQGRYLEVKEVGSEMYKALTEASLTSEAHSSANGGATKKLIKSKFIILKGEICDHWLEVKTATCSRTMSDADFIKYLLAQEMRRQHQCTSIYSCAGSDCTLAVSQDEAAHHPAISHDDTSPDFSDSPTEVVPGFCDDSPPNVVGSRSDPGPLRQSDSFTSDVQELSPEALHETFSPTFADGYIKINVSEMDPRKTFDMHVRKRPASPSESPDSAKRQKFEKLSDASQIQVRWALSVFTDWMSDQGEDVLVTFKDETWIRHKFNQFCGKAASSSKVPHHFVRTLKKLWYKFPSYFSLQGNRCVSDMNEFVDLSSFRSEAAQMPESDRSESQTSVPRILSSVNEVINGEDLEKLYRSTTLSDRNPVALLWKVWFDITFHLSRGRLRDRWHLLGRNSFDLCSDSKGVFYVLSEDVIRALNLKTDARPRMMYATPEHGETCPVRTLSLYLSRLNPNCPALFQFPRRTWVFATSCWYLPKALNRDQMRAMMRRISKHARLSRVYGNYSVVLTAEDSYSCS